MKEERFPRTRKALHGRRLRVAEGEASEPWRTAQPQGCGGQSGEIPAQRLGADQHSPAREACLLTRQGGRGLGAEARASVGSQGEDWGWWHEHSLKGASAPQLAGRESGKRSGAAEEARDFFLPLCFLVREERGFRAPPNKLQRWARAAAISADPRDGHETLRLLPPPRSLCASTGHSPHLPSREPMQPATARVP